MESIVPTPPRSYSLFKEDILLLFWQYFVNSNFYEGTGLNIEVSISTWTLEKESQVIVRT